MFHFLSSFIYILCNFKLCFLFLSQCTCHHIAVLCFSYHFISCHLLYSNYLHIHIICFYISCMHTLEVDTGNYKDPKVLLSLYETMNYKGSKALLSLYETMSSRGLKALLSLYEKMSYKGPKALLSLYETMTSIRTRRCCNDPNRAN